MEWYWILLLLIIIIGIIIIIWVAVYFSPVKVMNNDIVIASGKTLTVDTISATSSNANLTLNGNGSGGVVINPLTTFSTGLRLPNTGLTGGTGGTGGAGSVLSFYNAGSFVVTYGGGATGTATWQYTRVGNNVTVDIPLVSLPFITSSTLTVTGYPLFLHPTTLSVNCQIIVYDNGSPQNLSGKISIPTRSGSLIIYKTFDNAAFSGPGNIGHDFCSFNYVVN